MYNNDERAYFCSSTPITKIKKKHLQDISQLDVQSILHTISELKEKLIKHFENLENSMEGIKRYEKSLVKIFLENMSMELNDNSFSSLSSEYSSIEKPRKQIFSGLDNTSIISASILNNSNKSLKSSVSESSETDYKNAFSFVSLKKQNNNSVDSICLTHITDLTNKSNESLSHRIPLINEGNGNLLDERSPYKPSLLTETINKDSLEEPSSYKLSLLTESNNKLLEETLMDKLSSLNEDNKKDRKVSSINETDWDDESILNFKNETEQNFDLKHTECLQIKINTVDNKEWEIPLFESNPPTSKDYKELSSYKSQDLFGNRNFIDEPIYDNPYLKTSDENNSILNINSENGSIVDNLGKPNAKVKNWLERTDEQYQNFEMSEFHDDNFSSVSALKSKNDTDLHVNYEEHNKYELHDGLSSDNQFKFNYNPEDIYNSHVIKSVDKTSSIIEEEKEIFSFTQKENWKSQYYGIVVFPNEVETKKIKLLHDYNLSKCRIIEDCDENLSNFTSQNETTMQEYLQRNESPNFLSSTQYHNDQNFDIYGLSKQNDEIRKLVDVKLQRGESNIDEGLRCKSSILSFSQRTDQYKSKILQLLKENEYLREKLNAKPQNEQQNNNINSSSENFNLFSQLHNNLNEFTFPKDKTIQGDLHNNELSSQYPNDQNFEMSKLLKENEDLSKLVNMKLHNSQPNTNEEERYESQSILSFSQRTDQHTMKIIQLLKENEYLRQILNMNPEKEEQNINTNSFIKNSENQFSQLNDNHSLYVSQYLKENQRLRDMLNTYNEQHNGSRENSQNASSRKSFNMNSQNIESETKIDKLENLLKEIHQNYDLLMEKEKQENDRLRHVIIEQAILCINEYNLNRHVALKSPAMRASIVH